MGQIAASDLSTHHSKTAVQWHYRKTIGLKKSAGAMIRIVSSDSPTIGRCDSTMGQSS